MLGIFLICDAGFMIVFRGWRSSAGKTITTRKIRNRLIILGNLIRARPISFIHLPKVFLLHYYHIHSSHCLLYLFPMFQGHESNEKSTRIEEEKYEWCEHLNHESHFVPRRIFLRIIVLFPFAKWKIFEMQIFDKLPQQKVTFEGYTAISAKRWQNIEKNW